jgi:hypothetical protein
VCRRHTGSARRRPSGPANRHVQRAPTRSEILALDAAALGVATRVNGLPIWSLPLLGLFVAMLGACREMRFQCDRPYRIDSRRFAQRFRSDATPFEVGAPAAALSFKAA